MSNDSNVSIDGEIDAGFTSYWDSDKHGQTVGGTTEDDLGEEKTVVWPDIDADPEDLTDLQEKIIREVAVDDNRTQTAIAEKLGTYPSAVSTTLSNYWPEKSPGKKGKSMSGNSNDETPSNDDVVKKIADSEIETIRQRALNGESRQSIAEDYKGSKHAIGERIRGRTGDDSGSEIPPLEYSYEAGKYVKPDEWAEKEDDKRVDQHETEETESVEDESESQETDVQEILGVLKKTAVHQETKQALDVLEGYL